MPRLRLRRHAAANWTTNNPTLYKGELGYETDTAKLKMGDGVTAWTGLSYYYDPAGGGGGNSFTTIAVSGQSDVVADSSTDTLTLVAGTNVTITTNAGTDTVTIAASGGSGGGSFWGTF